MATCQTLSVKESQKKDPKKPALKRQLLTSIQRLLGVLLIINPTSKIHEGKTFNAHC
jgi:hypothetical protein